MAQKKIDGVIEAVHYDQDGQVELARVYERRGPTYSDRLLLTRKELIERLKAKKHFFIGSRVEYLASTFNVNAAVQLTGSTGSEYLVTNKSQNKRDLLEGAPLF